MPTPFSRALPILRGIDALSSFGGDTTYVALVQWLRERGEEWDDEELATALDTLQADEFIDGSAYDSGWISVGLATKGRQVVAGWPSAGSIDAEALASAIVASVATEAEAPGASEEVKSLARRLGEGATATAFNAAVLYGMKQAGIG